MKENVTVNQVTLTENLLACPLNVDWANAAWKQWSGLSNYRGFGKGFDKTVGLWLLKKEVRHSPRW